ncbi:uncharacterized protein TRIADDRAFT_33101, partial [Trichoplax adhaerens]
GCLIVNQSETYTVCSCNHLTHFAIMLQITEVFRNFMFNILQFITYIGIGFSIISMAITIFCYTFLRYMRKLNTERFFVHKNFILALILAQIMLIITMNAAEIKILCKISALLLHLSYLASFTWMFVEGLHLYFVIIAVFNHKSKIKLYLCIGWGIPTLIVGITVATHINQYGLDEGLLL